MSSDIDGLSKKKHRELYNTLLKTFVRIEKTSKELNHDDYAVVNVAPSVVPNPYLPSFRIFSYNITGEPYVPGDGATDEEVQEGGTVVPAHRLGCDELEAEDRPWRCELTKRWNSNPNSPSRRNGLWTPLGFAQVSVYWDCALCSRFLNA